MVHDVSTPAPTPPASLWRVLLQTFREASKQDRNTLVSVIGGGTLMIFLQFVLDADNNRGTWGVAESISLCLGLAGSFLLSVTLLLQGASQKAAGCGAATARLNPQVLHQMLFATPVLGVVSGLMLGTAAGVTLARMMFRGPVLLIAVVVYLGLGLYAAYAVSATSRFLYSHARDQADLAARAKTEVTEARMSALAAQIHPHYLFNALNTVAALVRTDPKAAERTVENVSQVLRRTLDRSGDSSGRMTAPLSEEIEYLRAYLGVEKERWGERLKVSFKVASEALALPVPPLVLQPLVENALKHGLSERLDGGMIEVTAGLVEGRLVLAVADDGAGLPPRWQEGTGLSNLRRRLATLYGEAATLALERRERGSRATVKIPLAKG